MTTRVLSVGILLIGPLLGCGLFAKGQTQGCPNSVPTSTPNEVFKDTIEKVRSARTVAGITTDTKEIQEQTRVQNAGAAVIENMVPFLLCFGQEGLASVIEAERLDKQVGSSSSSSGTTSLTSNGSVPDLLGLALENGALTQSVSGTTVTFRGNPAGIIEAMAKKDYFKIPAQHDEGDPNTRILRNISFALTFDISRGSTPNVFTGSGQQLASYSFRYDILNRRDPRDQRYRPVWEKVLAQQGPNAANRLHQLRKILKGDSDFSKWLEDTAKMIVNAPDGDVETVFLQQVARLKDLIASHPEIQSAINGASRDVGNFVSSIFQAEDTIHRSPILTFEYTNTRQSDMASMIMASTGAQPASSGPTSVPNLSTFKLIAEKGFVRQSELTTNASLTIFDSIPTGTEVGRVRDFQLSAQLDVPLPEISQIGKGTLTFSGLYLNLLEQPLGIPIMVNGQMVSTRGHIELGQAKITFPVRKGSGVKVPLSITYASRTELNREKDVRGNIGMTFDLDSIFAGLKQ